MTLANICSWHFAPDIEALNLRWLLEVLRTCRNLAGWIGPSRMTLSGQSAPELL